jgi:Alternative complex III, ActD subunit
MTQVMDPPAIDTATGAPSKLHGIIAEFETVNDIMHAAKKARDEGYKYWDVHSPFPVHGIDSAMGIRPTILPWIVLICGMTGTVVGLSLALGTMATDWSDLPGLPGAAAPIRGYRFLISGKPFNSLPAYIPIIFETTILLSAFGAVFGMLLLNRLPKLYNPLLKSMNFRRSTADRFFIEVQARDPRFDQEKTAEFLKGIGAVSVELIEDD